MRRQWVLAAALMALAVIPAAAETDSTATPAAGAARLHTPLTYDPYYVLPGAARTMGIDAGINNTDLGSLADASDVFTMAKYAVNQGLEVGARATFGSLRDGGRSFSSAVVGAKLVLGEKRVLTGHLKAPLGDREELGLSFGLMQSMELGTMPVDAAVQVGMLKGYADQGAVFEVLIEPSKVLNEKTVGYLDVSIEGATEQFGDELNIDLRPYLDHTVQPGLVVSGGVNLNLYNGVKRWSEVGLRLTVIKTMGD
jgi:hypothetical protein